MTFDAGTALRTRPRLSYSAIEAAAGRRSRPTASPGVTSPDVTRLRRRLEMTDDLASNKATGEVYDEAVTAAVRRFQARHGLEQTGSLGPKTIAALNVPVTRRLRQLAASLDRLAGMDFVFGQRYVVVNLPAAFAEAVVGDKVVRRHVVQVGRPDRPSPTLTTHITTVNLNPTWTVPLGILKKDVIPKMRKDPGYASRMHMKVLDGAGNEVDPHSVDWNSTARRISPSAGLRQLERARLRAHRHANPHSVYMHDTNHKDSSAPITASSLAARASKTCVIRRLGAGRTPSWVAARSAARSQRDRSWMSASTTGARWPGSITPAG